MGFGITDVSSGDGVQVFVTVTTDPNAEKLIAALRQQLAQLRGELALAAAEPATLGEQASTSINRAIGAFQAMGRSIDVTNAKAVSAFRAQGDALSTYLVKIGATDAELDKLGATIAKVEQEAGARGVLDQLTPPGFAQKFDANAFAIRRGGDALSLMAFAAATGTSSLQSMTIAAGSVTTAVLSLGGVALNVATGIGTLVSLGAALVATLTSAGREARQTKAAIDSLTGLDLSALTGRLAASDAKLAELRAQQRQLQADAAKLPAFNPDAKSPAAQAAADVRAQLAKVGDQIDAELKRRRAIQDEVNAAQAKGEQAITDQALKDDREREESALRRIDGEFAARRKAAENEFQDEQARIRTSGLSEERQRAAIASARAKQNEELAAIDDEQRARLAARRAEQATRDAKATATASADAAKEVSDRANAANEAARATRQETERAFIAERLRIELQAIDTERDAQLTAINAEITARTTQLAQTADRDDQAKIRAQISATEDARTKIVADANQKRVKAQSDANQQTAALDHRLTEAVDAAVTETLQSEGKLVEATSRQLHARFDDDIKEAEAAGDAIKAAALRQAIDLGVAHAQLLELEKAGAAALDTLKEKLNDTKTLSKAGAISQGEAQERVTAAYAAARDTLAQIIPQLERVAALTGDAKAKDAVAELGAKLAEISAMTARTSDEFAKLKAGSIDALQRGLEVGIDQSIQGAKSLREAWANAALAIVASISRIVSALIAQAIATRALKLFSFSDPTTLVSSGVGVLQGAIAPGHASGGLIRGPGTATSDSILARLSAGEFVLSAAAVRRWGVDMLEAMNAGMASVRLQPLPGFAEGGLATAVPVAQGATWKGESIVKLQASRDVILEVLSSTEGQQVQLETLQRHGNTVRSLFGRGR